jgi:hypothetical protein
MGAWKLSVKGIHDVTSPLEFMIDLQAAKLGADPEDVPVALLDVSSPRGLDGSF